mmetsp:Transcript_16763/g.30386  ORF Transcript_16763/g.30386 Transcript_16763/m.30386 type:complete len:127 (+) Transcript_16763:938-1318(+)
MAAMALAAASRRKLSVASDGSAEESTSTVASPGRATPVQELDEDEEDVVSSSDEEDQVVFSSNPVFLETYTLQELAEGCPDGVKPYEKEKYLSNEEFFDVFSIDRAKFSTYPQWKRDKMKKEVGLY